MADVKICGLSTRESVEASVNAGARFVGFVFFPPSPRAVTATEAAGLAADVPPGVAKVGLFVAPDDTLLEETLGTAPLDFIQLHKVHHPARIAEIRALTGLPVITALPVETTADVDRADAFTAVSEMILFDAKATHGAKLPGGNGISFDWRLLANRRFPRPWMLAGGPDAGHRRTRRSADRCADRRRLLRCRERPRR